MKTIFKSARVMNQVNIMRTLPMVQVRTFSLKRYHFNDTDYVPTNTQISAHTHGSNAEELVNQMPIVQVHGNTARCTGVNAIGLGHPVQYIQLNKRITNTPATCKWCGLRFQKVDDGH